MLNRIRMCTLGVLACVAFGAAAQEPEVGDLLIASGSLDDPNYAETVLLIVHNGEDGTIAVALNRPTWVEAQAAFPDQESLANYTDHVYFGGPVSPSQPLIVFERGPRMPQNSRHIVGSIYVSADPGVLDELDLNAPDAPRVRLFAGHAAWVPGQLAREIAGGTWRNVPGGSEQIFARNPETLWDLMPLPGEASTASLYRP